MISGVIFCHKLLVVHCAGSNASKKKKEMQVKDLTLFFSTVRAYLYQHQATIPFKDILYLLV